MTKKEAGLILEEILGSSPYREDGLVPYDIVLITIEKHIKTKKYC